MTVRGRAVGYAALLALPAAGMVALALRSGGFFPDTTAVATVVVLGALLVRTLVAGDAADGLSVGVVAVAGLLCAFGAWELLSSSWSHAPARSVLEFARTLLYAGTLLLFGTVGRSERRAAVLLRYLAVATWALAVATLAVWLFPDRFHVGSGFLRDRLSWPTSYWNATGLLAGLGIVWTLHLAAALREPRALRVAACALMPAPAAVLFFTASRGAAAATVAGVAVYVLGARPRGLLTGGVVAAAAAAAGVIVAANADGLAVEHVGRAGIASGQHAAWALVATGVVAGVARALLLAVDRRLERVVVPRPGGRVRLAGAAAVLVVCAVAFLAVDGAGRLDRAYAEFTADTPVNHVAPTERFGEVSGNGRIAHWRVAIDDGFVPHPWDGAGAGTFALLWARERKTDSAVVDGHSLYIEVLGELGLVGAALVVAAVLSILVALALRCRGARGAAWPALFAAGLVWAIHAGVDWDWEMPATAMWLFAAGGLALAAPAGAATAHERRSPLRLVAALACLGLALIPVQVYRSQRDIAGAVRALRHGDCATTVDRALGANAALSARPEPLELLAYCDVRLGRTDLAQRQIAAAVARDPGDWGLRYGQALVQAAAGVDPEPAARAALARNPRHPFAQRAVRELSGSDRAAWRRRALAMPLPINAG